MIQTLRTKIADWLDGIAERLLDRDEEPTGSQSGLLDLIIVTLILAVVSIALSELLRPKPKFEQARPAALGDFQFPTAIEGRVIPLIWGTVKLSGPNVVWYGDLKQTKIKKKVPTGLFSSKNITVGFKYYVGIQFALCCGPSVILRRIWVGDKVVMGPASQTGGTSTIAQPKLFGGDDLGSGGIDAQYTFFGGALDQDPSAYLASHVSPLPAYRGTSYLVVEQGYIGNSTTVKPWAFEASRFPNALGALHAQVNDDDANPACVIYEILTDTDWGFGFTEDDVDVDQFKVAAKSLYEEGNGFSFTLDSAREAGDILHELERQIDGLVRLNQRTGKYELFLARGDFDIGDVTQINDSNTLEVITFGRGTWEGTANQVKVEFVDRAHDYAGTFAQGTDLANLRIQGGERISVTNNYPGLKNKTLANRIATRDTKALTTPLARASVLVTRDAWDVRPGDIISWTWTKKGILNMPMRVNKIDLGDALDGRIKLDMVQDIYEFTDAFDGDPPDTSWELPRQQVEPYPDAEEVVMEAPRAFITRDSDIPDRVWAGARKQSDESLANVWTRHDPTDPSGNDYVEDGEISEFFLIGTLANDLSNATANPVASFDVEGDPDSVADIVAAITQNPSTEEMGQNLVNLLLVGDEFMAVTSATDETTHAEFDLVYRGLLDSVPAAHLAGAKVYLVCAGGTLSDSAIPRAEVVDVQLRAESRDEEVEEGDATTEQITLADRYRRPYPPTSVTVNEVLYEDEADLDFDTSA